MMSQPEHNDPSYDEEPYQQGGNDDEGDVYDPNQQRQQGDENDVNDNQQQEDVDADSYGDSFGEGQVEQDDDDIAYNGQPGTDIDEERFDDENQNYQQPYGTYGGGDRGDQGYDGDQRDQGYEGNQGYEGEPGYDAGQDPSYGQDQQPRNQYDAGEPGYDAGQDGYGQDQPYEYDQYGQPQPYVQPQPYGQTDPYGQEQPDPYGQNREVEYGEQPEQARPMPKQVSQSEILRKNILWGLICITCLLFVVVILVVVLMVLLLGDDDETTTPKSQDIIAAPTTPAPAPVPTSAPATVPAPVPTPVAPTSAPTASPVSTGWQTTNENTFSASRTGAGFGGALAIAGSVLVAGLPDKAGKPGFGTVVTYSRGTDVRTFSTDGDKKEDVAELYGTALDMSFNSETGAIQLAVGAPRTDGLVEAIVSFGSVFVYRLDENEEWSSEGGPIRSTETLEEAGGEFGASVALAADVDRVAVGAPSRSLSQNILNTGGVTVFELQNNTWTTMPSTPLFGPAESYYGKAIDLSNDGNGLLVGAPGRGNYSGLVQFFKWNGFSTWESVYAASGTGTEALGTTVSIINSQGTQIAYGVPGSNNNRGAVRVFEEGDSEFTQMGEDIVGEEVGEMVGMVLCAKSSRIAIGTQTGILRIYDFSGSAWVPLENSPDAGAAIVTCAMSDNGRAVVVGLDNEQVQVYDLITPDEN